MARFIHHYAETGATDKIYLRLDSDDPFIGDYLRLSFPDSFIVEVGSRVRMPGALNEGLDRYPEEPCYGMLGDDVVPRSKAWDEELKIACGAWGISYGRDGQNDGIQGRHALMGGELARAWGCLALEKMTHLYNDTVWMALGEALGVLIYLENVYMEHVHFSTGKSSFDAIYDRRDEQGYYADRDREIFEAWKIQELPRTVKRIQAIMPI